MPPVHRMGAAIPVIEVTDNRDRLRIGCPDSKIDAPHPIDGAWMSTHLFVDAVFLALPKQVEVVITKNRRYGLRYV